MYLCKARPFVVVCFNEFVIDVAEDEVGECSKSSDVSVVNVFLACMFLCVLLVLE